MCRSEQHASRTAPMAPRGLLLHVCALLAAWAGVASGGGGVGLGNHVTMDPTYADGVNGERPPRPVVDRVSPQGLSVHVAVSSYRDRRCGRSLFELFSRARRPALVTAGVVEQFRDGDERCVESYCELWRTNGSQALEPARTAAAEAPNGCPFLSNIRVRELDAEVVHGPAHARSFAHELRRDEAFCMQVDSHIWATNEWDEKMVGEWERAGNEYAVLSTYMQRVEDMASRDYGSNVNGRWEIPVMCSTQPGLMGAVRNSQAYAAWELERPLRSCFWGAGLSFSKCHMEDRVPKDPHVEGVFDGEEFSQAIRMWTHGYDVYAPSRAYLFHDYNHQRDPKKWSPRRTDGDYRVAYRRMLYLLGMAGGEPQDLGPYGMGHARSKAAYEATCRMELQNGPVADKSVCGAIPWVPFDEADLAPIPRRAAADGVEKPKATEDTATHGEDASGALHANGITGGRIAHVPARHAAQNEETYSAWLARVLLVYWVGLVGVLAAYAWRRGARGAPLRRAQQNT